eukprot:2560054-Heterocapsa_arctica.AAC.1
MILKIVLESGDSVSQARVLLLPVHDGIGCLSALLLQVAPNLSDVKRLGLTVAEHLPVHVNENEDLGVLTVDPGA